MINKRIQYSNDISIRLSRVALKLKIKHSKQVSQDEIILRYIEEGLKRDEKKLIEIEV